MTPLEQAVQTLLAAPPVRIPLHLCACGHPSGEHRTDLKVPRCDGGGCPCPAFTHGQTVVHTLRWELP